MILHEGDPDYFNQGSALFVLSVIYIWHALLRYGPVRSIAERIVSRCNNQAMLETIPFNWYERGALNQL
jgi:hypothetical protein